jgi:hypothetical protein
MLLAVHNMIKKNSRRLFYDPTNSNCLSVLGPFGWEEGSYDSKKDTRPLFMSTHRPDPENGCGAYKKVTASLKVVFEASEVAFILPFSIIWDYQSPLLSVRGSG